LLKRAGLCTDELLQVPTRRWTTAKHFFYLHLQKCGGTSVCETLADTLGPDKVNYGEGKLSDPNCNTHPAVLLDKDVRGACDSEKDNCCVWRKVAEQTGYRMLAAESGSYYEGFDQKDFCPRAFPYATMLRAPIERAHSWICEDNTDVVKFLRNPFDPAPAKRDNYMVRVFADAWGVEEGAIDETHLLKAAKALAAFDVVMTLDTAERDGKQMAMVGLPDFKLEFTSKHAHDLNKDINDDHNVAYFRYSKTAKPNCDEAPTQEQLEQLVGLNVMDALLYEFASVLAATRSKAMEEEAKPSA